MGKSGHAILLTGFYGVLILGFILNFTAHLSMPKFKDPETDAQSWGKQAVSFSRLYPKQFDDWYPENFPLRSELIHLGNRLRYQVLRSSTTGNVLFGKRGHLFFAGQQNIEIYRHLIPFPEEQVSAAVARLEERASRLAAVGIKYILVVAPDPHTIYPEDLPDWVKPISKKSRLDQFVEEARSCKYLTLVDLRPSLIKNKSRGRLYHLTDTHWNDLGAFIACEDIMKAVDSDKNGAAGSHIPHLDLDHDYIVSRRWLRGGDLANMLGLADEMREEEVEVTKRNGSHVQVVGEGDPVHAQLRKNIQDSGGFTAEQSHEFDTINPDVDPSRRVLVFRDSFCSYMTSYISEEFYAAHYVWSNGIYGQGYVDNFKPTVVIQEVVERSLNCDL
jgi:alginate O-acetyltransferase complex protein AlgJ